METNTESQSGNVEANAEVKAPETKETTQQPADENPASQSEGQESKTSASPEDTDASKQEDGKVAEADKNETVQELNLSEIKIPEGFNATDDGLKELGSDLKELGIGTTEQAQKFVDWIVKQAETGAELDVKQQEKAMDEMANRWIEEGKKDPVLGKDYEGNVESVNKLAQEVFSPRTRSYLDDIKLMQNPDFLKDMVRLAKERSDAALITGETKPSGNQRKRDRYGNPVLEFNS